MKEYFKPEFAKGLTSGNGSEFELTSLTDGVIGKFVSLYGFDDLIDNIPTTIKQFKITNNSRDNGLIIKIPENIDKFVDLDTLLFDNCIDKVPNSICNLKKLLMLGLPNNSKLTQIPECIADMPNLLILNVKYCENLVIPEKIKKLATFEDDIYTFSDLI